LTIEGFFVIYFLESTVKGGQRKEETVEMGTPATCRPDPESIFLAISTDGPQAVAGILNSVVGAREVRDANGATTDHWLAFYHGLDGSLNRLSTDRHGNLPIFYTALAGVNVSHLHEEETCRNKHGRTYQEVQQAKTREEKIRMMFGEGGSNVSW
jgi:hypothetical protein